MPYLTFYLEFYTLAYFWGFVSLLPYSSLVVGGGRSACAVAYQHLGGATCSVFTEVVHMLSRGSSYRSSAPEEGHIPVKFHHLALSLHMLETLSGIMAC